MKSCTKHGKPNQSWKLTVVLISAYLYSKIDLYTSSYCIYSAFVRVECSPNPKVFIPDAYLSNSFTKVGNTKAKLILSKWFRCCYKRSYFNFSKTMHIKIFKECTCSYSYKLWKIKLAQKTYTYPNLFRLFMI